MRSTSSTELLRWIGLASIVVNLPYFTKNYYPVHDTLSVFQFFSYYYSQIYFTHELPWWLPLSAYGMPIDSYLLFSFGPFQYLALTLGYLLHTHHTLFLFSLSLTGDTFFFALGTYLFSRHILQNKWIALLCTLSVLLLVQYDRQIYWNFKTLLPLPLCLYWVQLAIERASLSYLLANIATLLCWTFGSIAYVLPVQVYVIACYGLCLLRKSPLIRLAMNCRSPAFAGGKLKKLGYISLGIIALCGFILYQIQHVMLNHMAYNAIGRQGNFGVSLQDYLTYGGNTGTEKLFELLNGIPTSHPHDFLAYVGIVNILFVIYGLCSRDKSKSHIALFLTTLLLLAFTITSTDVAELVYVLPGMNRVRHIGYFITIVKLLLILLGGFGIQAYWKQKTHALRFILPIIIALLSLACTPLSQQTPYTQHTLMIAMMLILWTIFCAILKFLQNTHFESPRQRSLGPYTYHLLVYGLLIISCIDMISYRMMIYKIADLFAAPFPKVFKEARPIHYPPTRIPSVTLPYMRIKGLDVYSIGSSYLQEDFCPAPRQDLISSGVKTLFNLRQLHSTNPRDLLDPMNDKPLRQTLGCRVPKLRLVSKVRYAQTQAEAGRKIATTDIYQQPVILSPDLKAAGASAASDQQRQTLHQMSKIQDFTANRLQLFVDNPSSSTAWLIYADAFNLKWQASIDGQPQAIFPANLAFKAIPIKPGQHEVKFNFTGDLKGFMLFWVMMCGVACAVLFHVPSKRLDGDRAKR